jgi:hypothetical protein
MKTIPRKYDPDPNNVIIAYEIALFDEWLTTCVSGLQNHPTKVVGAIARQAQDHAFYGLLSELPTKEKLSRVEHYHWFALANFLVGAGKDGVWLAFNNAEITLASERKSDFMGFDDWKFAYDACMVMRDMKGLQFLSTIQEDVMRQSNQKVTEFELAHFRLLSHFFTGGENTGSLLVDAVEKGMKPQENSTRTRFVDLIYVSELFLVECIIAEDEKKFNTRLAEALRNHKKYWETKAMRHYTRGYFSFGLLALCVMAADTKKFAINVESPYIPRWLIFREYE